MSFRHKDRIYISATGSCFGTMKKEDFAVLSMDGTVLSEKSPAKNGLCTWHCTKNLLKPGP